MVEKMVLNLCLTIKHKVFAWFSYIMWDWFQRKSTGKTGFWPSSMRISCRCSLHPVLGIETQPWHLKVDLPKGGNTWEISTVRRGRFSEHSVVWVLVLSNNHTPYNSDHRQTYLVHMDACECILNYIVARPVSITSSIVSFGRWLSTSSSSSPRFKGRCEGTQAKCVGHQTSCRKPGHGWCHNFLVDSSAGLVEGRSYRKAEAQSHSHPIFVTWIPLSHFFLLSGNLMFCVKFFYFSSFYPSPQAHHHPRPIAFCFDPVMWEIS